MGLEYESLSDLSPIVVDIETCGLPNAADFLEPIPDSVPDESPIEADRRLTDPAKIAADIDKKRSSREEANREAQEKVVRQRAALVDKCALDWNVGRIVALAWWTNGCTSVRYQFDGDAGESEAIAEFWRAARQRTIIGFNVKGFDLRFLVQRSRYLGIPHPHLNFSKYDRKGIHDLYLDLTFGDGTYDTGAMRRTLKAFAKRFGLPVNDDINGADIPALVATGEWDRVAAHVISDVELTVALARKLGAIVTPTSREAVAI